jgi:hypothetical protein
VSIAQDYIYEKLQSQLQDIADELTQEVIEEARAAEAYVTIHSV